MMILLSSNKEIIRNYINASSKIGLIKTAYELRSDQSYIEDIKRYLLDIGNNLIDIDITHESREDIINKFNLVDVLFVAGGNCFYLLQQLKIKDVLNELIKFSNEKIYIGESAGACIVSPSIKYADKLDDISDAPLLNDYAGMNLIDGYILPHYNSSDKYTKLEEQIMNDNPDINFIKLTNSQAIIVNSRDDYMIVVTK